MNPRSLLSFFLLVLLLNPPAISGTKAPPPEVQIDGIAYFSLKKLAASLGGRLLDHPLKRKVELRLGEKKFVFTWLSSVAVINDGDHRMPQETKLRDGVLHIPAQSFFALLAQTLPGHSWLSTPKNDRPQKEIVPQSLLRDIPQPEISQERWSLDRVIIDPGHGGKDPGAIGPGKTEEKQITLKVARRLKAILEKQLGMTAILTRDKDTFVSLRRRSKLAIQNQGKLFISLHCNASKKRKSNGSEVYFLSDARTKQAAEVARRENAVVRFEKNGTESVEDDRSEELIGIQFGLLSSEFLKESQDVAAEIGSQISSSVQNLEDRGVKQADFYVMRGTMGAMPSVLIEIGFISNPSEEKRLKKGAFQKKMAEAIGRGIANFRRRYEGQLAESD